MQINQGEKNRSQIFIQLKSNIYRTLIQINVFDIVKDIMMNRTWPLEGESAVVFLYLSSRYFEKLKKKKKILRGASFGFLYIEVQIKIMEREHLLTYQGWIYHLLSFPCKVQAMFYIKSFGPGIKYLNYYYYYYYSLSRESFCDLEKLD